MPDEDLTKFEFDKDPNTLTDEDLVSSHSLMHRYWNTKQEKGEVILPIHVQRLCWKP